MQIHELSGRYDWVQPITPTPEQAERIIEFFQRLFPGEVVVRDVDEPISKVAKGGAMKSWTPDELVLLMNEPIKEVMRKTNRSVDSVSLHRVFWGRRFQKWMLDRNLQPPVTKEMVTSFLKEDEKAKAKEPDLDEDSNVD